MSELQYQRGDADRLVSEEAQHEIGDGQNRGEQLRRDEIRARSPLRQQGDKTREVHPERL